MAGLYFSDSGCDIYGSLSLSYVLAMTQCCLLLNVATLQKTYTVTRAQQPHRMYPLQCCHVQQPCHRHVDQHVGAWAKL